ncbi:hypothetical protein KC19_6G050100 [Ceratodon purpureus]|uniref:Uncharacterized protein n=1 Tax=Ceratodon purpureus TaxID=3225 RepID=A0A8T0HAS9_CERPU|nr:hypothetical protein KC19_6G050100 [Ceratodon purpureus]
MAAAMNVHLLSFPIMVEDDFVVQLPTITLGQVSCILSPQQVLADYACFANSSGGAVVCDNKLVGIHTEALYGEEDGKERAMRNNTDNGKGGNGKGGNGKGGIEKGGSRKGGWKNVKSIDLDEL